MVYVDELLFPFRGQMYCHMYSPNMPELHQMAHSIGLKRAWFQDKPDFPHYDLSPSRRALAVKYGAKELTCLEMVELKNANTPHRHPTR